MNYDILKSLFSLMVTDITQTKLHSHGNNNDGNDYENKQENDIILIKCENTGCYIKNNLTPYQQKKILYGMGYKYKQYTKQRGKTVVRNVLISKFVPIRKYFPYGMLDRLKEICHNHNFKYKILDNTKFNVIGTDEAERRLETFNASLRNYQLYALRIGLKNPLCLFHMATSSGKTCEFAALSYCLNMKTLILVDRQELMYQHMEEIKKFCTGKTIGIIQQDDYNYDNNINIGLVQSLYSKIKNKDSSALQYLNSIEYLVLDECHKSTSDSWESIIRNCSNRKYLHAFSGSPWDNDSNNIELEAVCGKAKVKITTSKLIDLGFIARPIIKFLEYENNYKLKNGNTLAELYRNNIVINPDRNKKIIEIIKKIYYNEIHKMLVIVKNIEHGKILSDLLRQSGISDSQFEYVHGTSHKIKREKALKDLENGKIRILIASNIFNEGINIPSVDVCIKCDSYGGGDINDDEGVRALIQQIGRILRKPKNNKGEIDVHKQHDVYFYDFLDRQNSILSKWTNNRINTVKSETNFEVVIAGG